MNGFVEVILIIGVVAYVLIRRLLGEPVEVKRVLVLPGVVTVIGFLDVGKVTQSAISTAFLLLVAVVSIGIGVLRGMSIRVTARGGVAYASYTWVTLVLWAVSLGVKFGSTLLLSAIDPAPVEMFGGGSLLTLGLGLLAEGAVVMLKASRSGHRIISSPGRGGRQSRGASAPAEYSLPRGRGLDVSWGRDTDLRQGRDRGGRRGRRRR